MGYTSLRSSSMGVNERQNTIHHCLGDSIVSAFVYMEPIVINGFLNIRKNGTDIMKCSITMQAVSFAHDAIGLFVEIFYVLFVLSSVHALLILTQSIFLKNCR